jgi:hypothetical protein
MGPHLYDAGNADYRPITTSLSFLEMPQSSCILFNIVECVLVEPTEFFTISVGPATANVTIVDSDGRDIRYYVRGFSLFTQSHEVTPTTIM